MPEIKEGTHGSRSPIVTEELRVISDALIELGADVEDIEGEAHDKSARQHSDEAVGPAESFEGGGDVARLGTKAEVTLPRIEMRPAGESRQF
jgi:hypothetical protein